jgi:hypothetical protein
MKFEAIEVNYTKTGDFLDGSPLQQKSYTSGMSPQQGGLLGAFFGVLGAGFAVFIARRMCGEAWQPLLDRFPYKGTRDGEVRFQSLSIRLHPLMYVNMGSCAALRMTEESIAIRVQFPVSLLFAPVEIPWSAFEKIEVSDLWWRRRCAFATIKGYAPTMIFLGGSGRKVYDAWLNARKGA